MSRWSARAQARNAETELERIFTAYQLKFEDPNLGRTAASYPDYATILDAILTTGLHERREVWRQRLMKWSGEDLVPLAGSMESSIDEIEERLDPINSILRDLPFGANRDRLRIKLRRLVGRVAGGVRTRRLGGVRTRDVGFTSVAWTRVRPSRQFRRSLTTLPHSSSETWP